MSALPLTYAERDVAPAGPEIVERDLLATLDPLTYRGRIWIASLLGVMGLALVAYIYQLVSGLHVTSMRNYVSWGTYMTNFVFFIGISHAGTLISAILRVTNAGWRRPITRMAEAITVFALLVGANMVVIDMGRPDRVLNVILHGRLQSPILWDLVSVTTYITGSFLYLYVAMIPDMPLLAAAARARGRSPRLIRLYEILSLGYRETPEHRRRLARALGAMAVIIIPVAVSVHTVVSWVFGMTLRPGWHSTIFGPYFVIGAIFSGTAAIITAMALFRRAYRLEHYLLPDHFRKLAKLLLALSLLYAYFTLSEYLTAWYGGLDSDRRLLELLAGDTSFGLSFWLWAVFGLFVPIALLLFPSHRSISSIVTASVLINIGMWIKRDLIIVPTLQTTFIPAQAGGIVPKYFPSLVECTITAGAFAAFALLFTLFSRLFPILSIWETAEDAAEQTPTPESAPHRFRAPVVSAVSLLFILAVSAAVVTPSRTLGAQAVATPAAHLVATPAAHIALQRTMAGDTAKLAAKVTTADGKPVPWTGVAFLVKRTFGLMPVGEEQTGEDGVASIAFPSTLAGDSLGNLEVHALLRPDSSAAQSADSDKPALEAVQVIAGGTPFRATVADVPRALWSSRPPLPMVATICGLALCVWSTYAFVIGQLVALRRLNGLSDVGEE